MKIGDGIEALELSANMMGRVSTIHLTLFTDERGAVLVDAAYPGMTDNIREALEGAGVPLAKLDTVFVTHHDIDHIGSLSDLVAAAPGPVDVLTGAVEKEYVEGRQRPAKFTPERIEQAVANLPEDTPDEVRQAFKNRLESFPKADVTRTIEGGQAMDRAGGIDVISTPGHTPGHLSLYHRPSRTLVAGDAMVVVDGELRGPAKSGAHDLAQAHASLAAFADYDIDRVICYHGGVWEGDGNARIREILEAGQAE